MEEVRSFVIKMWTIVIDQFNRSKEVVMDYNLGLINEVNSNEKRIDSFELKIDMDVENFLNKKLNDTREIISVLKINYNLERIGDYAYTICKLIEDNNSEIKEEILKDLKILEMFDIVIELLNKTLEFYKNNDKNKHKITEIYTLEEKLNRIKKDSIKNIYKNTNEYNLFYLDSLVIIHKLERAGDHVINIIEEIIFYVESKIIKHEYLKDSQIIYTINEKNIIEVEDILLDKNKFTVNKNGINYNLAKKEFELFHLLISDVDKVFTRKEILSKVWGDDIIVGSKTIDVHIRNIRKKLNINNISSVKGVGYKYMINK